MCNWCNINQTISAKVFSQERNSSDYIIRSLKIFKYEDLRYE